MKKIKIILLIMLGGLLMVPLSSLAQTGFTAVGNFFKKSGNNVSLYSSPNYRLGVGTNTPTTRLAVTGTTALDPFGISSTSGVSLFRVTQAGNLGVGTTTPGSKLVVVNTGGTGNVITIASSSGATLLTVNHQGFISTGHIIGNTSAPAVATSTGAGAGPGVVASVSGTDMSGFVNFTTSNGPAVNATIVSLTFSTPYTSAPHCSVTNATTSPTFIQNVYSTSTISAFLLKSTTTALTGTSTYAFYYHCNQ